MQIDDELVFVASLAGKYKHMDIVDFPVISYNEHCNKKISSKEKLLHNRSALVIGLVRIF